MKSEESTQNFYLDEVLVSTEHNQLSCADTAEKLQPRVMAVLCHLACHHDRVISNDELIDAVWEGRVVTHASVQKSINQLRNALSSFFNESEVIAHYSKNGYQLKITPDYDRSNDKLLIGSLSGNIKEGKHVLLKVGLRKICYFIILAVSVALLGAFVYKNSEYMFSSSDYGVNFSSNIGYTNIPGHERGAAPHPIDSVVAFIKYEDSKTSSTGFSSSIIIRKEATNDWVIIEIDGAWTKLEWSPTGEYLAAIEDINPKKWPANTRINNYHQSLYNIHIFKIDVNNKELLDKHRLSQWQGKINSISWWQNDVLELVASQGIRASFSRYRYSFKKQRLDLLKEKNEGMPLYSKIKGEKTAVLRKLGDETTLNFLKKDQSIYESVPIEGDNIEFAWIPDGSGVLVNDLDNRKFNFRYPNKETVELATNFSLDEIITDIHFDGVGRMYYTESRMESELYFKTEKSILQPISEPDYMNYGAVFSPSGEKIAYVSIRNNQSLIMIWENGHQKSVIPAPIKGRIERIRWSEEGILYFNAGKKFYSFNLADNRLIPILMVKGDVQIIGQKTVSNELFFVKKINDVRNLWTLNSTTEDERQLTFGDISSAEYYAGEIYIQFVNKAGLWRWDSSLNQLLLISPRLPENSRLLEVGKDEVFYSSANSCVDSRVWVINLHTQDKQELFYGEDAKNITSFKKAKGVLFSSCVLPESDIMRLE